MGRSSAESISSWHRASCRSSYQQQMACRCQYQHASDKSAFGRCEFLVRLRGRVAVVVVDMKLRLACLDRNQTSEQLPASQPSIHPSRTVRATPFPPTLQTVLSYESIAFAYSALPCIANGSTYWSTYRLGLLRLAHATPA